MGQERVMQDARIVDWIRKKLVALGPEFNELKVRAELDVSTYPSGMKVSKEKMETLLVHSVKFHGDWDYTIRSIGGWK
jgi:Rhodopirellula transposase DDE domain